MLVRSLTLALVAACLWTLLILIDQTQPQWCTVSRPPVASAPIANPITIIDLAAQTSFSSLRDLADLVRLDPDENIVAVDDQPVVVSPACAAEPRDCDRAALSASRHVVGWSRELTAARFVDFTVASATASRRVLVLFH